MLNRGYVLRGRYRVVAHLRRIGPCDLYAIKDAVEETRAMLLPEG